MKTTKSIWLSCLFTAAFLTSCTNNNRGGSNMSEEGTVQSNSVNAEMEDNRTAADVDTVVSPGSNAVENKNRDANSNGSTKVDNSNTSPSVTPGSGKDPNMAGQSDTHGKKTTAGDK